MKRGTAFLFFGLIIFCLCPQAYSAPLVFGLNTLLEGQPPEFQNNPGGNSPWLSATFDGLNDAEKIKFSNTNIQVKLELDAGNLKNGGQYVSSWLFNFKYSYVTALDFYDDKGNSLSGIGEENNGFKAGPDGFFDIELPFEKDSLTGGSALTYYIGLGGNLLPEDFDFLNSIESGSDVPGSFYSAAQINGIGGSDGEAWVAAASQVPESATMLLLGFGLMGMAVVGRSKFLK